MTLEEEPAAVIPLGGVPVIRFIPDFLSTQKFWRNDAAFFERKLTSPLQGRGLACRTRHEPKIRDGTIRVAACSIAPLFDRQPFLTCGRVLGGHGISG